MKLTSARCAAIALIAIGGSWGCDKPPVAEMDAARTAVDKARSAGAETYAVKEFARLNDSLAVVQTEVKTQADRFFPSYGKARTSLTWVDSYAREVSDLAVRNKEKMRAETQAMVDKAAASIDSVTALLATAPKGKGTQQDLDLLQNDVNELRTLIESARSHQKSERFSEAQSTARSVEKEVADLTNEIKSVIQRYEELKSKRGRRR